MKIDITDYDDLLARSPADLIAMIKKREDLGFDGFGLGDLMRYGLDVLTFFVAAAAQTDRIMLFPNVGNPVTRHPWLLASIASTYAKLAPGRFRLNIGAGTHLNLGRPPARLAEMRETVTTIRTLLAGEPLDLLAAGSMPEDPGNNPFRRTHTGGLVAPPPREHIPPVCMTVGGPQMMELAGEIADEVVVSTGHEAATVKAAKQALAQGAAKAGRSLDAVKFAHFAFVYVDDDEEAAYDKLIAQMSPFPVGLYILRMSLDALGLDWPDNGLQDMPRSEWKKFLDATAFVGPLEKIADRFQDVARSGELDRMVVGIGGVDKDVALEGFGRIVIPRCR